MLHRTCFAFLFLLLARPASGQERTHAITPDDYFTLNTITEVALAPDGKHVAYCLSSWDRADDKRMTDLWLVGTDGKEKPIRLTFDRANDRLPKWSADGQHIYFLGNRKREAEKKPPFDGTTQVWRIEATGGDPKPVTREADGISSYDLAPLEEAIYFSKDADHRDEDAFSKLRAQFDKVEYGHGKRKVSEVHRLDLNSWRSEKRIDEKRYIREFAVTPDGKQIAMIAAPDDTVIHSEGGSQVEVWDAGTGKVMVTDQSWRKTAGSPWPWLGSLAWSTDGTRLAYCTIFDAYPTEIIVCEAKGGKWPATRVQRLDGYHVRGYGSPLRWNEFGGLIYLAERAGLVVPASYSPKTGRSTPPNDAWAGKVVYATDRAGRETAVVASDAQTFPDLFVLDTGSDKPRRLTDVNAHTKTWLLPSVRHITWKAPDGTAVGGVLELPYGTKPDARLPLVVAMHGGPTTATKTELSFDPHNGRLYFTAKGYAVLLPNYRGSTGYGDQFVTDLIGHENDLDVKDILAGIQHLVQEGIADPDRVGVMGWSNGGFLTNCLITLTDPPVKIRAASSGAGILDTVAEWGFNDEPAYAMVFKKGLPWEQPETYRKTSPTYGLGNVTAPTLIHVGGSDDRCPPGHSRMLHRALKEYKQVPTELVVYTGEPHGLTKMSNRKAKMEWDLAWFEKYLLEGHKN